MARRGGRGPVRRYEGHQTDPSAADHGRSTSVRGGLDPGRSGSYGGRDWSGSGMAKSPGDGALRQAVQHRECSRIGQFAAVFGGGMWDGCLGCGRPEHYRCDGWSVFSRFSVPGIVVVERWIAISIDWLVDWLIDFNGPVRDFRWWNWWNSSYCFFYCELLFLQSNIKQLILDANPLGDAALQILLEALPSMPHINRISLACTDLTSVSVRALRQLLTTPPARRGSDDSLSSPLLASLTDLNLSHNDFSAAAKDDITEIRTRLPALTLLKLEDCGLTLWKNPGSMRFFYSSAEWKIRLIIFFSIIFSSCFTQYFISSFLSCCNIMCWWAIFSPHFSNMAVVWIFFLVKIQPFCLDGAAFFEKHTLGLIIIVRLKFHFGYLSTFQSHFKVKVLCPIDFECVDYDLTYCIVLYCKASLSETA